MKTVLLALFCLSALFAQAQGADTDETIRSLRARANAHYEAKRYRQAVLTTDSLLNIIEEVSGGQLRQDYVVALSKKGLYLINMGDDQGAEACYMQAMDMERELNGEESREYISLLCAYAYVLGDMRKDYQSALGVLGEAYELLDYCEGNIDKLAESVIVRYNAYYQAQTEQEAALKVRLSEAKNAVKTAKNKFGKTSDEYAEALWAQAGAHIDLQQYAKALKVMKTARDIKRALYGSNSLEYGKITYEMALVYDMEEDSYEARVAGMEALPIMERHLLPKDPEYFPNMMLIAEGWIEYELPDSAMNTAKRAISTVLRLYGNNSIRYAQALQRHAAFLFEMEHDNEALDAMRQCLSAYEAAGAGKSLPCAMAHCQLARMMDDVNMDEEAMQHARKAADMLLPMEGKYGKHYKLALETVEGLEMKKEGTR